MDGDLLIDSLRVVQRFIAGHSNHQPYDRLLLVTEAARLVTLTLPLVFKDSIKTDEQKETMTVTVNMLDAYFGSLYQEILDDQCNNHNHGSSCSEDSKKSEKNDSPKGPVIPPWEDIEAEVEAEEAKVKADEEVKIDAAEEVVPQTVEPEAVVPNVEESHDDDTDEDDDDTGEDDHTDEDTDEEYQGDYANDDE